MDGWQGFDHSGSGASEPIIALRCEDGVWPDAAQPEGREKLCSEWCNSAEWGCGEVTVDGSDERNVDNEDYRCNCAGCNGCPAAEQEAAALGAVSEAAQQ